MATDLLKDKTFYWRLRPYNNQHTCTSYTEGNTFSTGSVTAVRSLEAVTGLVVSPNPAPATGTSFINLSAAEPVELDVVLLSATGQTVQQFPWQVVAGSNRKELTTNNLPAGLYFLHLQSAQGVVSQKLVLQ